MPRSVVDRLLGSTDKSSIPACRTCDQVFLHISKYQKHYQLVQLVVNFMHFQMYFMYFLVYFVAYSVQLPRLGSKQVKNRHLAPRMLTSPPPPRLFVLAGWLTCCILDVQTNNWVKDARCLTVYASRTVCVWCVGSSCIERHCQEVEWSSDRRTWFCTTKHNLLGLGKTTITRGIRHDMIENV